MATIVDADAVDVTPEDNVPPDYRTFRDAESIPVHTGLYVEDVNDLATGPWDRTGQAGAFLNLDGAAGVDDIHVHDVAPGGETTTQCHLYEEMVYVTRGQGVTSLGVDEDVVFEWSEGAVFFVPPNTPYRHVNTAPDTTARLVAQTPLPQLFSLVGDEDIIFPDPGSVPSPPVTDSAYSGEGTMIQDGGAIRWDAEFVPDVGSFDQLETWDTLGSLQFVGLLMHSCGGAGSGAHIGDLPPRTYKTAHRHAPGASVFVLSGSGYTLMWREGWDELVRIDWSPGSVFVPPARWYHQHFNLTDDPARTFALHCPKLGTLMENAEFAHDHPENVVAYVDEPPVVRETFEAELAKRSLESGMPEACYTDPDFSFSG